jgi:D-glycerate 3-kinase
MSPSAGAPDAGLLERVQRFIEALPSRSLLPGGRARPWVLGISGPQGSGKSTLARALVARFAERGARVVDVSIDDFYLTRAEQRALAAEHPGCRCFDDRGYPGTHDVALGARTIDALLALGPGERLSLVRYDKSAHEGRGDRAARELWPVIEGPLDGVVVEGWMLGFAPVSTAELEDAALAPANEALAAYAAWNERLDGLVVLEASALDDVVRWRVEAERARREAGQGAMDDEAAEDYVRRFLPAYRTWVPGLRASPPVRGPSLHVLLGADRAPRDRA